MRTAGRPRSRSSPSVSVANDTAKCGGRSAADNINSNMAMRLVWILPYPDGPTTGTTAPGPTQPGTPGAWPAPWSPRHARRTPDADRHPTAPSREKETDPAARRSRPGATLRGEDPCGAACSATGAHPRLSQHRQQPDTPRPDRDLGGAHRSSPRCTASAPPTGLFDGIYAVPPGAALLARDGRVKIRPYWDTDFPAAAELATDPRSGQSRAICCEENGTGDDNRDDRGSA